MYRQRITIYKLSCRSEELTSVAALDHERYWRASSTISGGLDACQPMILVAFAVEQGLCLRCCWRTTCCLRRT